LGESPGDGPPFTLVGDGGYIMEHAIPENRGQEAIEERLETTRATLNRLMLPVLRNQIADLDEAPGGAADGVWRDALAAEIRAMQADPQRLPWQDGLPTVIENSLQPFRERLETSYSDACNALEMGLARR
jgi:hypothetical protein